MEALEGKAKGSNTADVGKEKDLEIKMRSANERANRAEERVGELERDKKRLSEQVRPRKKSRGRSF